MRIVSLSCLSLAIAYFPPALSQHLLEASPETVVWGFYDSSTAPVLHINSGDSVTLDTLLVSGPEALVEAGIPANQVQQSLRDIHQQVERGGPHILTGPIFIEDAQPGDVLEVRILDVRPSVNYATNLISPGGFLGNEFPDARTRAYPIDMEAGVIRFADDINIPLRPFFGSMGVAPPPEAGRISSGPPWIHAGNLDNKELIAGSTLFIPVHVPGALFHAGDGHAAQGDGEVSLTALETSLTGTFQFIVHKDRERLSWPRAETPEAYITMGMDPNLTEAARIAVREMIKFLVNEKNLTPDDAYSLTSVAIDLRITQLVDGNKGVHAMLWKSLFEQ